MIMSVKEIKKKKNKKEYAMKKALNTMLIVIVSLLAFVACSPEKAVSDELVSATLISTDRVTRALETEVNFDLSAVKLWKYKARKANGGLTTGQTELGEDNAATLNSDGTTAGLSQGAWNFVLYGYDATANGKLIAQGSINNATVTIDNHDVTITVNPLQTSGAKGKIVVSNDTAIVSTDSKTTYKTGTQGYTISYNVYKSTDTSMSSPETDLNTLAVGSYKVVVEFKGTVNGVSYTAAKAEKVVNVYAGLTTTVKGTIGETEQAAKIKQESGVYFASASESVNVEKLATPISLTANSSPVGAEKSTKVSIPANAITLSEGEENSEVELTVVATEVATETSTFTLVSADEESPVLGAIDITLKVGNEEKTDFSSTPLTITTYVAQGLNGGESYNSSTDTGKTCSIQVKYNGEGESGTVTKYDATTGELTFTVNHLSTYYVVDENAVAYNSTLSTAYTSLADAVTAADTANTSSVIELLCDASGNGLKTSDGNGNVITYTKSITIDFNNHTYTVDGNAVGSSGTETQAMHWGVGKVGYVTIKDGKLVASSNSAKMSMQNYAHFTAENMELDFTAIIPDKYEEGRFTSGEWVDLNGKEITVWGNNAEGTVKLHNCTVTMNSESSYGICESGSGTELVDTTITGYVSLSPDDHNPVVTLKGTTTISQGGVSYMSTYYEVKSETLEESETKYSISKKNAQ